MQIRSNSKAIDVRRTVQLIVDDGVGPYTWTLSPDQVGGQIDVNSSDSALASYTGPSEYGFQDIVVTDSNAETATIRIFIFQPILLVADLIKNGLGLSDGQVHLYNQKFKVPNDSKMYVSIGVLTTDIIRNRSSHEEVNGSFSEIQSATFRDFLDIRIQSSSQQALLQRSQIPMAFNNDYARNQMALNSFMVANHMTKFVNVDDQIGAYMVYGFNFNVSLQYAVEKIIPANYYETFSEPSVIVNK